MRRAKPIFRPRRYRPPGYWDNKIGDWIATGLLIVVAIQLVSAFLGR